MWFAPNGNLIVADFNNINIVSLAFTGDLVAITVLVDVYGRERPPDVGGTPWLSLFIAQKTSGLLLAPSTDIGSMWSDVRGVWVDC